MQTVPHVTRNFGKLTITRLINFPFWFQTVEEGAETTVHLAVSEEVESVSGKYFSDCKKTFAVPWATDSTKAKRLWEESVKMTQVKEAV